MNMPVRLAEQVGLGELGNALGFLLRLAQLKVFARYFEEVGDHGIKPGEFSVLWVIGRNPGIRQSLLGQRLMIKRAHMTKLIRLLEDQGLVSRRIPEEDRRAVELTLTANGKAAAARAKDWFFPFEGSVGTELTAVERKQLIALLQKLVGVNDCGL